MLAILGAILGFEESDTGDFHVILHTFLKNSACYELFPPFGVIWSNTLCSRFECFGVEYFEWAHFTAVLSFKYLF